ncbi:helix-turn-helix transcriptional regulator [Nocardia otitidiscaviarum]|uniref:Helix-turn-helix transcriptional regulator n=1 Tax=Nocardia otitidiscaviarum TaxID=1823 RepID=A0A516NFF6_9NOCA|nr:helix-turn-helix transcriptional regulator [Nocardia otitidiscaviarum]MCP9622943.1 helix-turn-helix domain-containing protein [Nocardia otitidiscaviarum]QDP77625.1 helix-turn-helix transcriptional regulator [Nocardia otitidiscaviarum]
MSGYSRWRDIRAGLVDRAGGEEAVAAGREELLAEVIGQRLAEIRLSRGLTQQQIADRMGVTKGRISQIERGHIAGYELLARYATALGGRLQQSIHFDDGETAAIA